MKWVHPLKGLRIKERLAEVLAEKLGCEVYEDQFWLQPPGCAKVYLGIARWGWDPDDRRAVSKRVASFDTMRDCLRFGFDLEDEGGYLCATSREIVNEC